MQKVLDPILNTLRNLDNDNIKLLKVYEKDPDKVNRYIECACQNCRDSNKIFSRVRQIKKDPNPDGVVDDMFAEIEVIPYLLSKGFTNINYIGKHGADFQAEFYGCKYFIEVTFLRGPCFKTQKKVHSLKCKLDSNDLIETYILNSSYYSEKLVRLPSCLMGRLNSKYKDKKDQLSKHNCRPDNSIIIIVSHLFELHATWLEHATIEGKHIIEHFVDTKLFPTVIFSNSVYEPSKLDKLEKFSWDKYLGYIAK